MGKTFHGPFRITELDELKVSSTGEVFVRFRDISGNIIGAILDPYQMRKIARAMETTASEAIAREADAHIVLANTTGEVLS